MLYTSSYIDDGIELPTVGFMKPVEKRVQVLGIGRPEAGIERTVELLVCESSHC
jgi:hypothetical protein